MSSSPSPPAGPGFARRLSWLDATMIVVSGIVGSGIFINPYVVARAVETPGMILGVWLAGGLIALAGAFVFAELSTVLPKVGGQYAFFRVAFHPLAAFLHGWGLLWIVQSGATAAVAIAFAKYLGRLLGLPDSAGTPLAVAVLVGVAAFHALGIKPGAVLLNVVTLGKTVAFGALVVGAFFVADAAAFVWTPLAPPEVSGWPLLSVFFSGLVPAMFCYGGWQNLNYVAEEVQDPERNLPRAILAGVIGVIVLYVGANVAYLHVLGPTGLAASTTPAADLAARVGGETLGKAMALLIVISTFGFLNLSLLAAPRVYYAMAADGLFFARLARLSPRFRAPTAAIWLQAGVAAALALLHGYERLLSYAVFADWVFFAASGVALFVLRRKLPAAPRPFPTPGYPWVPALFTLASAAIVINVFVADLPNALAGTGIFLLGVPVYFAWRALARRARGR